MEKVAFVDQLCSVNQKLVEGEYGQINDKESAKRFGVRLLQEFSFWGWRSCGIACVAMILKTRGKEYKSLYDLVCQGLAINGYAFRSLRGGEDIGWKHKSLCQLLKNHGVGASKADLDIKKLTDLVQHGHLVIASVKSAHGGHLVLVKDNVFTINNPCVFNGKGGEDIKMSPEDFSKIFLGRGVIV